MVIEELGGGYQYAIQEEQLGTGHAVLCAEEILKNNHVPVMVLYGDMPYISAETIANIAKTHVEENAILTMATVTVVDFDEWRAGFFDFSRIIRDENGKVVRTVEKKDATEAELQIREVNPCYFCFDSTWLWTQLRMIGNSNAQHEYYLTDLVKIAVESGVKIATVSIDPKEALGVNTKEHLALLHSL
jgi:bifunctional UDP-N-acetylglucosamine pyrophosphorylase/glucosamine-1-phosphate N-acetyltransferase